MIFRKLGGSYQYWVSTPEELPEVLRLDPALWAALSVPAAALNADRKFLTYLDFDANGIIRLDDVENAVKTVQKALRELKTLGDAAPQIAVADLKDEDGECKARLEFIASVPELAADGVLRLADVSAKLDAVASGALRGDGILRAPAVADSGAETLFAEVLNASGGGEGISAAQLEKFVADATAFLDWAKQTERPKFRDADPAPYYAALTSVRDKIDEYFRFCELLRLDPAHEKRFKLDPDNLPPLDIRDKAAVEDTLYSAPLAAPNRSAELDLTGELNPGYRENLQNFSKLFAVEKLTPDSWTDILSEIAPYVEYLARAQGDNIGRLGQAKLEECLADDQPDILRGLFTRDGQVGGVLNQLRALEKIILFKQYLWPFLNNFVCFKALFTAGETSMIQAGRLIMDGRTFELTLWIDNIAAHKSIAVKSHLCLIYLELTLPGGAKKYVATAVTGGDLKRIYVGKPAFFIDAAGKQYNGKIVDLVAGPISFWQTVFEPFRRLGQAISGKTQKLTDYSSTEKAMSEKIDKTSDKLTTPKTAAAPAAPQPAKSGGLLSKGNGTMLLLAGGLSIAAIGAALSYVAKTIASMVSAMIAMPPWQLFQIVLTILLILFAPLALYAILQLRKRNLTLFLEAAGWAINLPMRLNSKVSRFFTFFGIYPDDAKFKRLALEGGFREDRVRRRRRRRRIMLVVLIVLLLCGLHCWKTGKLQRWGKCVRTKLVCRGRSCKAKPEAKTPETKCKETAAPAPQKTDGGDKPVTGKKPENTAPNAPAAPQAKDAAPDVQTAPQAKAKDADVHVCRVRKIDRPTRRSIPPRGQADGMQRADDSHAE